MDWEKLLSTRRQQSSHKGDEVRSEYNKDYDKIVFSSAFRRLGRKTQVHPLAHHDHVHTRLTHSLEVGSVGRSLGLRVGNFLSKKDVLPQGVCSPEIGAIVHAACLAHDIGNPPFGHAGEFAIRHWFKENSHKLCLRSRSERNDFEIFEGNAQGFRIVSKIENNYNDGGLRLTYATLGTLVKYPWFSNHCIAESKGKFNFFQSEKEFVEEVMEELGLSSGNSVQFARHPLSFLMEAADDICYIILDIEDALELNILRIRDTYDIFEKLSGDNVSDGSSYDLHHTNRRLVAPLRARAIENLIIKCASIFEENYDKIMSGDFNGDLIGHIKGAESEGLEEAKNVTEKDIFITRIKVELEIGSYSILETILSAYIDAVNEFKVGKLSFKSKRVLALMGANKLDDNASYHQCYLRVTDLVSGMTDNHAAYVAAQLSGHVG
ncbi:deoxyguanosinetriphosphate triphosphohydrolase [Hahella aquimaris]|uniref:deoxyguanosinetriphosphate triphosphohydrolase n=1 Tax=Hahella sp. HNIBRBA332 TaxID=3015983 RepID=UPI00273C2C9D|nr:deoxyguanosinetriphosphate triphosphohydrolase [Hahella sp. HNIBRBA332]WLQ15628.1 deoxyguanosinetriphosphate triphosphohydrolase [Hahella sp. HNIBRBA332]